MNDNGIVCVGEVLFDVFEDGRRLIGGAPFNVACHLRALGREVRLATRVGDDAAGREALAEMRRRGLAADLVQVDPRRPTGEVQVRVRDGAPRFTIRTPAAWQGLEPCPQLTRAARAAAYVVRGTLAEPPPLPGRVALDLNLRPPFVVEARVLEAVRAAALVKMNEDELAWLRARLDLTGTDAEVVRALAEACRLEVVAVTYGAEGAGLWADGRWWRHPAPRVTVVDTVGAGDAFLAGLLDGLAAGARPDAALAHAVALGTRTVTHRGALPGARPGRESLPPAAPPQ